MNAAISRGTHDGAFLLSSGAKTSSARGDPRPEVCTKKAKKKSLTGSAAPSSPSFFFRRPPVVRRHSAFVVPPRPVEHPLVPPSHRIAVPIGKNDLKRRKQCLTRYERLRALLPSLLRVSRPPLHFHPHLLRQTFIEYKEDKLVFRRRQENKKIMVRREAAKVRLSPAPSWPYSVERIRSSFLQVMMRRRRRSSPTPTTIQQQHRSRSLSLLLPVLMEQRC